MPASPSRRSAPPSVEKFSSETVSQRPYDAAAFESSPARALVDDLAEALELEAGTWKAVLPRLRDAARLRRSELVHRLAVQLGVGGREDKVARYYHEMEQGRLDPEGVSERVLAVLGELLGTSVERLREAGAAMRVAEEPPAAVTFARAAEPAQEHRELMGSEAPSPAAGEAPDEVDRLFIGGAET
jgi:hypothetical protein